MKSTQGTASQQQATPKVVLMALPRLTGPYVWQDWSSKIFQNTLREMCMWMDAVRRVLRQNSKETLMFKMRFKPFQTVKSQVWISRKTSDHTDHTSFGTCVPSLERDKAVLGSRVPQPVVEVASVVEKPSPRSWVSLWGKAAKAWNYSTTIVDLISNQFDWYEYLLRLTMFPWGRLQTSLLRSSNTESKPPAAALQLALIGHRPSASLLAQSKGKHGDTRWNINLY